MKTFLNYWFKLHVGSTKLSLVKTLWIISCLSSVFTLSKCFFWLNYARNVNASFRLIWIVVLSSEWSEILKPCLSDGVYLYIHTLSCYCLLNVALMSLYVIGIVRIAFLSLYFDMTILGCNGKKVSLHPRKHLRNWNQLLLVSILLRACKTILFK